MQALSLMNGPSQGERDFKLSKESAYRQLLKEQMEEGRRAKEAEKAKKKAVQEQELRELLQFEQTNVKKISNDKKILAMGEFGGQSVKSMLYNEEKGKEEEKQYQQPPIQNVVEPEPQQPYYAPQEPRQSQPQQPQQPIYVPPQPVAAIGGISALLNKSQQNPYSAAPAAVTALVAEAPAIKIREVFVDNPELIEKAEKFEELNSLYTDLLQNQQTMKRVLEENTNKMKRVADNEKSKMKTLMAGQRGGKAGARRRQELANRNNKIPERDAGGRLLKKIPERPPQSMDTTDIIMMRRSQSANRKRSPKNPYRSDNQEDVLVSPSRKRQPRGGGGIPGLGDENENENDNESETNFQMRSSQNSTNERDNSRFGFKAPARNSPARNKYNDNDNDNRNEFPETSMMENSIGELGGSSDLLYNEGVDPTHDSMISADQLDRLMAGHHF